MVKVVYFNQWFSSIAWVIDDLKKRNKNDIKVIISSKNENHAYKNYADEFIVEDWVETDDVEESMNNYVDWVLKLCKTYKVDIFFLKKHADYINKRREDFSLNGTFIAYESSDVAEFVEDKVKVYNDIAGVPKLKYLVPEFKSGEQLKLIKYLMENKGNNNLCMKLYKDEGGTSYKEIVDKDITTSTLYEWGGRQISTDDAVELILKSSKDLPLMIMEKLDSPEISVDCYNSKNGFIAICRSKEEGRVERLFYNSEIRDLCKSIGEKLGLIFPYNVQFRYVHKNNKKYGKKDLRLLEVNSRMSGGLYYEVAAGFNIADICLKDMTNRENEYDISKFIDFDEIRMTHLEYPIVL